MEEDFDDVIVYDAITIWSSIEFGSGFNLRKFISLSDWNALMAAHSNLNERHQKLLDLAGSSYL